MAAFYHTAGRRPNVEMILLDWTRMGTTYCVAGAVAEGGRTRVVRPLWFRHRHAPVRNTGWSPFVMDGHARWDVFELVGPTPAEPWPPHREDVWVRELNPCRRSASRDQRRCILEATQIPPNRPPFGSCLTRSASSAYLAPGMGERSLSTVVVPRDGVQFVVTARPGGRADLRVRLEAPGFEGRLLPLKDHFLLRRAEQASSNLEVQRHCVQQAVREMGDRIAVRIGLSRPYAPAGGEPACWLMADWFFSYDDPTP